jgi:hypothetical protein
VEQITASIGRLGLSLSLWAQATFPQTQIVAGNAKLQLVTGDGAVGLESTPACETTCRHGSFLRFERPAAVVRRPLRDLIAAADRL